MKNNRALVYKDIPGFIMVTNGNNFFLHAKTHLRKVQLHRRLKRHFVATHASNMQVSGNTPPTQTRGCRSQAKKYSVYLVEAGVRKHFLARSVEVATDIPLRRGRRAVTKLAYALARP